MEDGSDNVATPEKRGEFIALLCEYGNVSRAADEAGLNRSALYRYKNETPDFAELWDEAIEVGAHALEDEAKRRAFEGTLRPVFYQGQECGHVREYSDTLLIVLLKAHFKDKYGDKLNMNVSGGLSITALEKGRDRAKQRL